MPLRRLISLIVLVIIAGATTVVLASVLARLSVFQQMLVMDGAKVALSLLILFLCLRLLTAVVRK